MSRVTSDFGKGLAYNLALFMNHCGNQQITSIYNKHFFLQKSYEDKQKILSFNPPDTHNFGWNDDVKWWIEKIVPIYGDEEKALSSEITLWANGATDHLYEIEVPDAWKKLAIAKKIKRLQDRGLEIGHGFGDVVYTVEDLKELVDLTKEIALDIDKKIGLKPVKGTWE